MKTSKEMQLRILDKMRENVVSDRALYQDIQFNRCGEWYEKTDPQLEFRKIKYRIKPKTITINGVEIPKPLGVDGIIDNQYYYLIEDSKTLRRCAVGSYIKASGCRFVYETMEEAIEASKLLFGIKD